MPQNDAQTGKIMSIEIKSHHYNQQMIFSDSEINFVFCFSFVFRMHYFRTFFSLSSFHSFNNKQHAAEENVIIMGPKKSKDKEESKKKSKEPRNARRWTDVALDAYADALADSENSFAATLGKLALKKLSNNEVFEHIQK